MPASKQHEQYKKSRRGDEMPRLRGRLLALAIRTGDQLVQNPRKRVAITVDIKSIRAVREWFTVYYPKSSNRLEIRATSVVIGCE